MTEMNKSAYQTFRESMPNKGQPILKKTKVKVLFNPRNPQHLEAARILFVINPDDLKETEGMTLGQKEKIREEKEQLKFARENISFHFKLEPPYTSVKDMVFAKIVQMATNDNKAMLEGKVPSTRVLRFQRQANR